MEQNNFILDLIARLLGKESQEQVKKDIDSFLSNIKVPLIGTLSPKTQSQLKKDLSSMDGVVNLSGKVNSKSVTTSLQQATAQAQKQANMKPVEVGVDFSIKKDKLVNDIKLLAQQNSKLFKDTDMSIKYNSLLDEASMAKNTVQLSSLRNQLSAFKSELKVTGNMGLTLGDSLKKSLSKVMGLLGNFNVIMQFNQQLHNAWAEAKTLDDSLVDLQKVTDAIADRDALYKYFDRAMDKAQDLNVKVNSLIYAITEFRKLGWSLSDAELGGEWATILENVGDVDIDTAIGSIKTAIASFDEIGGYTDAQMDKKLEAYTDLINNMSNKYSIDAQSLSEAIRLSAGTLTEAHTSIEQAATMFSTANKYYNDASYLGHTVKIGSLRIRASEGDNDAIAELEEMGEEIGSLTEATSSLREKLLALTGVDIMIDDHTFKSYYDQLYEISQVIDSLEDTSRANVLETLFGKNRSAAGAALLSGMKESANAYKDAINSAGSATKEYETWTQSADAASQRFANNLTETYQNIINGNTVRDFTNLGSVVLEFANSLGLVEGTLKGGLAIGAMKGITTFTVALKNSAVQVSNYGAALEAVKQIAIHAKDTDEYVDAIDKLKTSCSVLTDTQLKQVLAHKNLSDAQLIEILQLKDLETEERKARLTQIGLTQAMEAQTEASMANLSITNMLHAAWTKFTTFAKANPMAVGITAIVAATYAAMKASEAWTNRLKDQAQESSNAYKDTLQEIESINSELQTNGQRIDELNAKENLTLVESEELERLKESNRELENTLVLKEKIAQQEKASANKDAVKYFNEDTNKYNKETGTYDSTHIEVATQYLDEIYKKEQRIHELELEISRTDSNTEKYRELSNELDITQKSYDDLLQRVQDYNDVFTELDDYLFEVQDDEIIQQLNEFYDYMNEVLYGVAETHTNAIRDILAKADFQDASKQLEELGKSGELSVETLSSRFPELIKYMDEAGISAQELYQYIMALSDPDAVNYAEIEKRFMKSLGMGDRVDTAGEAQIWNEVRALGDEEIILDAYLRICDQYGEHPEGWNAKDWISHIQSELKTEIIEVEAGLSISQTIEQLNTQIKPAFDSLKSAWQDIFTDDGFALNSIDILSTCDSIKSKLDDMSELGLNVDYSAFEDFVTVLNNTESTEQDVENAFDSLAASITHAALSGAEDFETMKAALGDLGVINNELVAFDALINNKEALKEAGLDLVAVSQMEAEEANAVINAFANEAVSAENTAQAIDMLTFHKELCNLQEMNTAGEVANLRTLAENAGYTGEVIQYLTELEQIYQEVASGTLTPGQIGVKLVRAVTLKSMIDDAASNINYEPKIDFSGVANGAKSAAKETEKEVDIMAELNSEMDKLQSAYESLCDIRDTYNKYGKITVDQYQELTDMGFNFLANLVDENGELGLNANAFEKLSQAKLQEMQIQMARNAIDTINGLKSEVEATEYLTYANENLRDSALSATEALLYQAQAAAHLRGEQQGLAADQIVQGYEASKLLAGKVDFTFKPDGNEKTEDSKSSGSDELLDAYNAEKKLLEHMLSMDQTSKKEYYDRLFDLVHRYFDGDEEHKDQIWDVEESYHDYLESIKETYNWIEVFLSTLAKKTTALIDKAEKFITWSKKNAMINRAVKATDREIAGQTNAYAYYAEKARKVKLSDEYINKIQNGTLTMEDMQNEALSNKIEKYQEWYDKMTECQDAVSALYDQERDLIKQKLDNVLNYYDSLDSYMSSIVSKMDSFISLMDDMGKRSSLTDLLEQFAAANEQLAHFQSKTEDTLVETGKDRFDSSQKVEAAKKRDAQSAVDELNRQKESLTAVQDTGTYKKLIKEIAKAEVAYDKQYEKLWAIDPNKDPGGKKWDAAQKKLDKLSDKLSALVNKKDDLLANATADNIVEYSKIYDAYMKLYDKQLSLEEKGKELSQKDLDKMESLFGQMVEMGDMRKDAIKELERQIGLINGTVTDDTEAEKIKKQLSDIDSGVKGSATYQNLQKDIDSVQAKIDKFWDTHDGATNAQQKQLDKWEAQLEAYYEKQRQLEDNATAETVGQYSKIYDAWKKLQDKLDAGKVLSVSEWKNYSQYSEQLKQFADERASAVKDLNDQLDKALNPGDKITTINREYEEAAEGIYESYQSQIDNISKRLEESQQYKDLLAKKQNLENIRDTKGLTASQEKQLQKYAAELEALGKGGTGDNISAYMKTWEKWYALQQKLDSGKKLSATEAANYDALKAQLDAWDKEKQEQISDLLSLMEDDLEKLRETNAENIAEAEAEINSYYSNIYGLAKQIAEYNINALEEQLTYLDAYISYYKELVSLYDNFSGDKLSKLLTDLDEDAMADQAAVYEKYLDTLETKYDATLSQINEYKQLIDAIDTNDFQGSMDLFQKAMDDYNAAGNTEMAGKLKSVLDILNERAVDADNWDEFADLWLNEWEQALADGKAELISTAGAIQEINDALREIRFSDITDALEELTRANDILSSMEGLIQEKWLYDNGGLSEYGNAKLALLVSQLENAQTAAEQYLELYNKILDNKDTYASEKAYEEDLYEAVKNYYASLNNAASFENSIMDIMKKAEEQELSSIKDIIEARKNALQKKKEYYDYGKKVADSQKEIDSIRAQIDALENLSDATDAATKAKLAQLKAELTEKEAALQETKDDHTYNLKVDALDELADTLTDAVDESTKSIKEMLQEQDETIDSLKGLFATSTDSINETMDRLTAFYSSIGTSIDGIDLTLYGKESGKAVALSADTGTADTWINDADSTTASDIVSAVNETTEAVKEHSSEIARRIANGELVPMPEDMMITMKGNIYKLPEVQNIPKPSFDIEKTLPTEFLQQQQAVNQPIVINNNYESLINVEGNVDEKVAKLLPQQLEQSYNYVVHRMKYGVKLSGEKPIRFIG